MNPRLTLVTAGRVLRQVRHDPRTIGLLVVVPCVLLGLLAWIYKDTPVFNLLGAPLLGIFPFVVMFLVTSIATLRECGITVILDACVLYPAPLPDVLLSLASKDLFRARWTDRIVFCSS